ncbi:MAG: isocitrate lyase/phosphoenolpyruvate mutase family protein [Candidatus Eisenbacteria bacterium]
MTDQATKCRALEARHQGSETFVIPNPWDAGSARLLQGLGFKALATTSSGFAFTQGLTDGAVTLQDKLDHCARVARATDIPISVDFEDGFARSTKKMLENVARLVETGVAGCSIEDYCRETKTLYEPGEAADRVQAAAEYVRSLDMPFQLVARAEVMLRADAPLETAIERLVAYEKAGAHVLFAPGLRTLEEIRAIRAAVELPLNVLASFFRGVTLPQFAQAGACRVSLGGTLTWALARPLVAASREMLEQGTFDWMQSALSGAEVRALLSK